eukprot:COSAG02_NODE_6012_length_3876_cov_6.572147_1_plen_171_part_00
MLQQEPQSTQHGIADMTAASGRSERFVCRYVPSRYMHHVPLPPTQLVLTLSMSSSEILLSDRCSHSRHVPESAEMPRRRQCSGCGVSPPAFIQAHISLGCHAIEFARQGSRQAHLHPARTGAAVIRGQRRLSVQSSWRLIRPRGPQIPASAIAMSSGGSRVHTRAWRRHP